MTILGSTMSSAENLEMILAKAPEMQGEVTLQLDFRFTIISLLEMYLACYILDRSTTLRLRICADTAHVLLITKGL